MAESDEVIDEGSIVSTDSFEVDDEHLGVVGAVVFVEFGAGGDDVGRSVSGESVESLLCDADGARHGGVEPDAVAEFRAVDVQPDEADVHRHAERVGGEFECDGAGEAERGVAITDYGQTPSGLEIKEHFVAGFVGSNSDRDEGGGQ